MPKYTPIPSYQKSWDIGLLLLLYLKCVQSKTFYTSSETIWKQLMTTQRPWFSASVALPRWSDSLPGDHRGCLRSPAGCPHLPPRTLNCSTDMIQEGSSARWWWRCPREPPGGAQILWTSPNLGLREPGGPISSAISSTLQREHLGEILRDV